jgi:hypothetical protein
VLLAQQHLWLATPANTLFITAAQSALKATTCLFCWPVALTPAALVNLATDLDAINNKLLVRRFTKSRGMERKQPPKVWCFASTTREEIMAGHLSRMRDPLGREW